ncbi:MAG: histidine--tRNA ligase [Bacilli bacterium]|nr:histidine--tRNA ligase [Bacilli bacterium]
MIIQNVKGGYDFLPKEQRIRNYINGILKEVFERFGYQPIETPILCYYDILAGKYDENNDILKEIYKLKDQGNRELGLRYDLTVPFAKFISLNKNNIKLPFKRYEINKVFRDGPVKVGRDREFTQCDVDVVGLSGEMIDAELVSLYVDAFNKLQIPINIKYNSRKLMSGLIIEAGIPEDLISPTITIVDKIDKLTEFELTNEFTNIGLNNDQITKLLEYFKLDLKELTKKFKKTENIILKEGLLELNNLTKYLKELKILKYTTFTPSLARGQDYYTGNVFEVYEKNNKITCAIGGGGRYDTMITNFINDGNIYPAIGISFGLTSIYTLLKDREEFNNSSPIDIFIIPMNTNIESLKLANILRELNYKVDIEMYNKKLKKSLDYCNKEQIPYVIILGEDELNNNSFKLKNMFTREEYIIDMNNISKIKDII